jgi:TRAP-type C4-dicarboxylate transport system substrate-binding protein
MPYLFRSTNHLHRILDGRIGEEILGSLSNAGLIGLCFYDLGARSFFSRTRSIRRAEEMRGLMVRVAPGGTSTAIVQTLGAKPVPMPFDRIQAGLKSGVIDAVDDSWTGFVGGGHFRLAKHYALTQHSMAPGVLVISKITWEQLPAADQTIIRAAAKESAARMRAGFAAAELDARRRAESEGVEVIDDVDRKSFADTLRPLYPVLLREPKLLDLAKRIQADDEIANKP